MSKRKARKIFKSIWRFMKKHKMIIALGVALAATALIPGAGGAVGKAISKVPISSALKVAAIGGVGYTAYKGSGKVSHEIGSHKNLVIGSGLAIGGIYLYSKMK